MNSMTVNRLPDRSGVAASMSDLFTPDDESVIPGQVTLRRGVIATERGQEEAVLIYDRPADGSFDVTRVLLIVKNPATNDWSAAKSATVGGRHLIDIAEAEVGQRIRL